MGLLLVQVEEAFQVEVLSHRLVYCSFHSLEAFLVHRCHTGLQNQEAFQVEEVSGVEEAFQVEEVSGVEEVSVQEYRLGFLDRLVFVAAKQNLIGLLYHLC